MTHPGTADGVCEDGSAQGDNLNCEELRHDFGDCLTDCSGQEDGTACNDNNMNTINDLCTNSICEGTSVAAASCTDTDGAGTDFDCRGEPNLVDLTATCASNPCTAAECCTVAPPPPPPARTCADTNADGTANDEFDCSSHANEISGSPGSITCAADPCTGDECCTVAPPPPVPRTCADTNADGTANDEFDCTNDDNDIDARPADIMCEADSCTAVECCTVTPPPPPDSEPSPPPAARTCADTDGEGTEFNCSDETYGVDLNGVCGSDRCTPEDCCTVAPPAATCILPTTAVAGYLLDGVACSSLQSGNIACDPDPTCAAGYTGTPTDSDYSCSADGAELVIGGCVDVDECTAGTDNCDPNAVCINTAGGYTCTCNSGYSGDGTSCELVIMCTRPSTAGFDLSGVAETSLHRSSFGVR